MNCRRLPPIVAALLLAAAPAVDAQTLGNTSATLTVGSYAAAGGEHYNHGGYTGDVLAATRL